MRKALGILLILFSCFFFVSNVSASSDDQPLADGTYVIESGVSNNMVLDVCGGQANNGTNVQLYTYNGTNAQKWKVKYLNNGYYAITSLLSEKMSLDLYYGNKTNGTNVQLYTHNGGDNQQWIIKDAGNGYYYIVSKASSLYVDVYRGLANNGTNIQTYAYNGGNNQKFKFKDVSVKPEKTIDDGTYAIESAVGTNMVLDVYNGSTNNGTNVQLYTYNGTKAQQWKVKYLDNGYYAITSGLSEKMSLDLYYGNKTNGTNVQLYTHNGGDNQQWIIKDAGNGYYYIVSKASSLYVDVYRGLANNGTNIQTYAYNGGNNQKFKFKDVSEKPEKTIDDGTYIIESAVGTNMALDVCNGSTNNGTNVQLYTYNGTNAQKWAIKYLDNGYYAITSGLSEKMSLDLYYGNKTNGTNVQLYTHNGGDNQQWIIKDAGNGYYYIVSKASLLYVDVYRGLANNGTNIQTYAYNGGDNQKFKFISTDINVDVQTYSDGVYNFSSSLNLNKALDVRGASKNSGTDLIMYENSYQNNQLWYLKYVSDGYYLITSALNTSLALTVNNNKAVIDKNYGNDFQLWRLKDLGNGFVSLISKANEQYLSLNSSQVVNSTEVILKANSDEDTQKFKISEYKEQKVYRGIDVSYHQNKIDWAQVAGTNLGFAIIRVGYGGNWTDQDDTELMNNVAACEKYNIPYGIYLYSYAKDIENTSQTGAKDEAAHVLRIIRNMNSNGYSPNLGTKVFLDIEDPSVANASKQQLTNVANYFCSTIENSGYSCGIYASKTWLETKLDAVSLAQKYDIWLAQWPLGNNETSFEQMASITPSYNLTSYKYWQFTSHGKVNGISTYVDLDFGYDIFD